MSSGSTREAGSTWPAIHIPIDCILSSGSRARISTRCVTKPPSTILERTLNPGLLVSISSGTKRARFRNTSARKTVPGCVVYSARSERRSTRGSRERPFPSLAAHRPSCSDRVDEFAHAFARRVVGYGTERRLRILFHVLRIARLRQHAGHGGVRENVFQRELRPRLAADVGGPLGQRFSFEPPEIGAIHERPVDHQGDAAVGDKRQHPLFRLPFRNRVIDLHEVRPFAL